jgi:mannitol/fructose-specific phosphotransferase system IIA component (Ntr-type)
MKHLLHALGNNALHALPHGIGKTRAIELLARHLARIANAPTPIEELLAELHQRERLYNTALGHGIAIPHLRAPATARPDDAIHCVLGWSPHGIAYDAPDDTPVHLIIMYHIPDPCKNAYLQEIAGFLKPFDNAPLDFAAIPDLDTLRARLQALAAAI